MLCALSNNCSCHLVMDPDYNETTDFIGINAMMFFYVYSDGEYDKIKYKH